MRRAAEQRARAGDERAGRRMRSGAPLWTSIPQPQADHGLRAASAGARHGPGSAPPLRRRYVPPPPPPPLGAGGGGMGGPPTPGPPGGIILAPDISGFGTPPLGRRPYTRYQIRARIASTTITTITTTAGLTCCFTGFPPLWVNCASVGPIRARRTTLHKFLTAAHESFLLPRGRSSPRNAPAASLRALRPGGRTGSFAARCGTPSRAWATARESVRRMSQGSSLEPSGAR
jgi:hypothetical protein